MFTSKQMYNRSQNSFIQSQKAFEAEISIDAFVSAELHLNMFTTIGSHLFRCAANFGLAFYCIANTASAVANEPNTDAAFDLGFSAIANHLLAAAIDFGNIFFTMGAILLRSFVTLGEGGYATSTMMSNATGIGAFVSNLWDAGASGWQQYQDYVAASALDFSNVSTPSVSM